MPLVTRLVGRLQRDDRTEGTQVGRPTQVRVACFECHEVGDVVAGENRVQIRLDLAVDEDLPRELARPRAELEEAKPRAPR